MPADATCQGCVFFADKGEDELGRCRRYPPGPDGFVSTSRYWWCGEHKALDAVDRSHPLIKAVLGG